MEAEAAMNARAAKRMGDTAATGDETEQRALTANVKKAKKMKARGEVGTTR